MITTAEFEALLRPLDAFADVHTRTLRRWGPAAIDMSYPNPRVHRDPRAHRVLADTAARISADALQYTPFAGATIVRRKVAAALSRRAGVRYGFRDIALTPGATAALNVVFPVFFRPGDEVLLVTPCWMDYPIYLREHGLRYRLVGTGPDKRLDPAAIARAWGPDTAGLIISQPTCPTGVLHDEGELAELTRVLTSVSAGRTRPAVLISDEAHRDQTWGEQPFVSPAALYPQTVSVYSFGKAWSMQGQRTGYLALSPVLAGHDEAVTSVERRLRVSGFCAPTAMMQQVAGQLCDLDPNCRPLAADQARLRALMTTAGYRVVPGQGTAFVYARSPDPDDVAFTTRLAEDHGLLAMPSSIFHEPGCFRLALNLGGDRLHEVADRLSTARDVRATTSGRQQ
jgi:aspartate aminotransferase